MTSMEIAGDRPAAMGLHFVQRGKTGRFVGLSFKIFFLSLVTLTVYRFWGRNEVRRSLWSSTEINGEPMDYTGTGLELFIGALLAVLFYVLPVSAIAWIVLQFVPLPAPTPQMPQPALAVVYGVFFVALLYLMPVAIYQALRYRLSRTQWRGIRFALEGSAFAFGLKFFGLTLLNYLLLGWLTPFMQLSFFRTIARRAYFGDQPFHFEGGAGRLYFLFAIVYFSGIGSFVAMAVGGQQVRLGNQAGGAIWVLGGLGALLFAFVALLTYAAELLRSYAGGVRFQGLRFHLDIGIFSYLWLAISNGLIFAFTFGILMPVTELRRFRYIFNRLSASGPLDLGAIGSSKGPRPRFGEGLAEVFGMGNV